jgi:alginate O-acetyltransferase complex protein AlgI
MGIVSVAFLATTLGAALAIRCFGKRVPRETLLLIASAVFIFCMAGNAVSTLPFWALVCGGFIVVRNAHRATAATALILLAVLVVLAWWWLRMMALNVFGSAPDAAVSGNVAILGLSYAMFRIIHLTVDARDDELGGRISFRSYLCYMTFFPNYLAGPVQRFQYFAPQAISPVPQIDATVWLAAGKRGVAGVFKCTILAGAALALHKMSVAGVGGHFEGLAVGMMFDAMLLAAAVLAFTVYLFFSFAGYMDVAISAGLVLGINVPENFNQPLRAKNFLDFWSRWHITLSDWFRFYIFNPLLKSLLATIDRPRLAPYLGAIGYFFAFFLMGIWHGRTPALIVYGLVLGAGVSINKLYQVRQVSSLGRRGYTALCERKGYQVFAQALALGYFALALCFLWKPTPDPMQIGASVIIAAALLVFVVCAMVAASTQWIKPDIAASTGVARAITAGQALAAAGYLWVTDGAVPELIYQWL